MGRLYWGPVCSSTRLFIGTRKCTDSFSGHRGRSSLWTPNQFVGTRVHDLDSLLGSPMRIVCTGVRPVRRHVRVLLIRQDTGVVPGYFIGVLSGSGLYEGSGQLVDTVVYSLDSLSKSPGPVLGSGCFLDSRTEDPDSVSGSSTRTIRTRIRSTR